MYVYMYLIFCMNMYNIMLVFSKDLNTGVLVPKKLRLWQIANNPIKIKLFSLKYNNRHYMPRGQSGTLAEILVITVTSVGTRFYLRYTYLILISKYMTSSLRKSEGFNIYSCS